MASKKTPVPPTNDPLLVVIPGHKVKYRFHQLAELFGVPFAERMAQLWPERGLSETNAKKLQMNLLSVSGWYRWVRDRADASDGDVKLNEAAKVLARHFEGTASGTVAARIIDNVARGYADYLSNLDASLRRRQTLFSCMRSFLLRFGPGIGIPPLSRNIRFNSHEKRTTERSHPSLAEITKAGVVDWSNPDEAIGTLLADCGLDEAALSFEGKLAAIARLNVQRLAALRRVMEGDLRRTYARFKEGERLLTLPNMPPDEEVMRIMNGGNRQFQIAKWLDAVAGGDPEKEMSLLLRWMMADADNGILPDRAGTPASQKVLIKNASMRQHFNLPGRAVLRQALQEFVSLGADGWTAAFTILLIDTGWNVQQVLDLPAQPFVGGSKAGKRAVVTTKVLTRYKARAGHDVDAVLAAAADDGALLNTEPGAGQSLSGIDVIQIIQEMTSRLRPARDQGPLFLCAVHGRPLPLVPGTVTQLQWWANTLERHAEDPEIGGLPISRPMIRKTKLDIAAMEAGGDHAPAQLLASHSSAATGMQRYLRTPWFQRELDNHIRRFQNLFEAAVSRDTDDVARHLGISPETLAERRSVAMETGLGFACLQPLDGVQPDVRAGQRCDHIDRCHLGCPARRFVPTEQGLTSLVLTNRSLREVENEWIVQNPARWAEVWMPLLGETEAYLDRLRDSVHRVRLAAAIAQVDSGLAEGSLTLIAPW